MKWIVWTFPWEIYIYIFLFFSCIISYEEEPLTSNSVIKAHLIRGSCYHDNTKAANSVLWKTTKPPPHRNLAVPPAVLRHPKHIRASLVLPYTLQGQAGPSRLTRLHPEQYQVKEISGKWDPRTAWYFILLIFIPCTH